MPEILVVGSLNADLVVRAPHFPQPGETISGEDLQVIPGGKGANQAVAAARLGRKWVYCESNDNNFEFGSNRILRMVNELAANKSAAALSSVE